MVISTLVFGEYFFLFAKVAFLLGTITGGRLASHHLGSAEEL